MKKKLGTIATVAALAASMLALAGCGGVGGTYYHIADNGSTEMLTLNKDHKGDDGTSSFAWTQEGNSVSLSYQLLGTSIVKHVDVISNSELVCTDFDGTVETYYSSQEKAEQAYDEAVEKWEAERDALAQAAREAVAGTWSYTNKERGEGCSVTFDAEGNWQQEGYLTSNGTKVRYSAMGTYEPNGMDYRTLRDLSKAATYLQCTWDGDTTYTCDKQDYYWQDGSAPQSMPTFKIEHYADGTAAVTECLIEGYAGNADKVFKRVG